MSRNLEKIMFEIYRDAGYGHLFRVVYYTELNEANRDTEINRAVAGEHLVSGYLDRAQRAEVDSIVNGILEEMNRGDELLSSEIVERLQPYLIA